jgi:hypothetical protein
MVTKSREFEGLSAERLTMLYDSVIIRDHDLSKAGRKTNLF